MMIRCLQIFVLLLFYMKAKAQFMDTLHEIFVNKSSIDVRLESRASFINHDKASITGVRIGVAFKRKLRVGGGVSWLKNDISQNDYVLNDLNSLVVVPKYLKLGYLCYYIDFVFHKTKRWQLSVPIQAGTGLAWFQHTQKYDLSSPGKKSFLFLYEPGVTTQFKIFRWFGLGADVGYRFTLKNNSIINMKLSSPAVAFKILFWLDQLYYQTFPNSQLTKKRGPAVW